MKSLCTCDKPERRRYRLNTELGGWSYCKKCFKWLYRWCSDKDCDLCKARPETPINIILNELKK